MKSVAYRIICLLLAICTLLSLCACGQSEGSAAQTEASSEAVPVDVDEAEGSATADVSGEVVLTVPGDEFGNGAVGQNAAVSSFSELTSSIGVEILQKGGNAVDAAVATILAVGLCEPHHSGIGGSGLMTIYLADKDEYVTIEYLETCPQNAYEGYYSKDRKKTVVAAAVPGQIHGLLTALEKYGTMSAAEVFEPVIRTAREGFELDNVVSKAMADGYGTFTEPGYEYLLELFSDEGFPYATGDTFVNNDFADTLEMIAEGGIESFYDSDFTQKMVDAIQAAGGCITREDFRNYTSVEREPIITDYYGYNVVTCTNPTCGGTWLLEALNIMEALDIAQYEVGSVEYWKVFNESIRIGMTDAYAYGADPAFYDLPTDTLISQEYADRRSQLFSMGSCIGQVPLEDLGITPFSSEEEGETGNTTHIAVIDKDGNIVSSTNTVGVEWGCYFAVEGTGFVFNSHLANINFKNPASPDYFAPGKRVHSSMTPTIVTKDGEPVMAVGSPGSLVIPCVVASVINNTLLYNMSVQEAINYPRAFTMDRKTATGAQNIITAETPRLDQKLIRQLEVYGYEFLEGVDDYAAKTGGVAAIYIDPVDGLIYAGGDPRRSYKAVAY